MWWFWDKVDKCLEELYLGDKSEVVAQKTVYTVPMPSLREEIYNFAKICLGKDIAATQNELGCAEAVSYILNHVKVPHFPSFGYLSTTEMYSWLKQYGEVVLEGLPGDIIISPTGTSRKGALHGHVGIVAYHGILSNNSMTGLFDEYYTIDKWEAYYQDKLGFPVLFYRL